MPRVTNAEKVLEFIPNTWVSRKYVRGRVGESHELSDVAFASGLLALHRIGRIEMGHRWEGGAIKVAKPKQGKPPSGAEIVYRLKA